VTIAVALVSIVTVDVGPVIRARAEAEASRFIDRPVHIGRLGVNIGRGRLVIDDLVVDGLTAAHDPWLVAKHLELSLTWRAILGREVLIDSAEISDWRLIVESYPNAVHNWPRLSGPPRPPRTGPPLVTTTVQNVRATRGHLIVRDFGSSWGLDAPNLEIAAVKDTEYHGTMTFDGGTLLIQQYEPMWARFSTGFAVREGLVLLENMALDADGAQVRGTGRIDAAKFPEATYALTSTHQLPRTRAIFYAKDQFRLSGEGQFAGDVRMFKGGYEVTGGFVSREAGYDDYRFQDFRANVRWVPTRLDVTDVTAGFYGGGIGFTYLLEPLGQPNRKADAVWDVTYTDVDLDLHHLPRDQGCALAGRQRPTTKWTLGGFSRASGEARSRGDAGRRDGDGPQVAADGGGRQCARDRRGPSVRTRRSRPCRLPATSPTRTRATRSRSRRAGSRPPRPSWPSTARPTGAGRRACRSTSRAATGRRATASWPAS
jgi:hypothetical protein